MKPKLKNIKGFSSKKSSPNTNNSSSSYLAEDENFKSFSIQLERLGLQLRDITGDGNCCFRALSDQMFGNESQHLDFRKRVCQYIRQNRDEFEPFVAALIDDEDDDEQNSNSATSSGLNRIKKPAFLSKKLDAFEKYIKNLEQAGTYADNGCLVAFARLYHVNINIHQLNMPIWTISDLDSNKGPLKSGQAQAPIRELHLSYHNGEHYSSIRPFGDNTNTPTNINFYQESQSSASKLKTTRVASVDSDSHNKSNDTNSSKYNESGYDSSNQTKNYKQNGANNYFYEDEANGTSGDELEIKIDQIIEVTKCSDIQLIKDCLAKNSYDTEQTINMFMANMGRMTLEEEDGDAEDCDGSKDTQVKKKDKKVEKKNRQMERQRIKVLEQREKEAIQQQKQTQQLVAGKSSQINDQNLCECNDSGCCSYLNNQASVNSNNSLDFNVSLSNIQTKTI